MANTNGTAKEKLRPCIQVWYDLDAESIAFGFLAPTEVSVHVGRLFLTNEGAAEKVQFDSLWSASSDVAHRFMAEAVGATWDDCVSELKSRFGGDGSVEINVELADPASLVFRRSTH